MSVNILRIYIKGLFVLLQRFVVKPLFPVNIARIIIDVRMVRKEGRQLQVNVFRPVKVLSVLGLDAIALEKAFMAFSSFPAVWKKTALKVCLRAKV